MQDLNLGMNELDIIISALIAIGTVGAVIYALFRDIFKRPKLEIVLEPHTMKLPGAKKHYRICVRNKRKVTAKNCILQVEELFDFKKGVSPSFYEPVPLEWKNPEIKLQPLSGDKAIQQLSPQWKTDIPPKGKVHARFVVITEDNLVFLNYEITQKNGIFTILLPDDRSLPLTQWLVEPNSRLALRLVAYAENADSRTKYCLFKKDAEGNLELSLITKKPKMTATQ